MYNPKLFSKNTLTLEKVSRIPFGSLSRNYYYFYLKNCNYNSWRKSFWNHWKLIRFVFKILCFIMTILRYDFDFCLSFKAIFRRGNIHSFQKSKVQSVFLFSSFKYYSWTNRCRSMKFGWLVVGLRPIVCTRELVLNVECPPWEFFYGILARI